MGAASLAGWISVRELAELAGATPNAVHSWLRRNARRPQQWRIVGKRALMHPRTAERYLNRGDIPSGEPEPGMIPVLEAARLLGAPHNRLLAYCHQGRARCTRWRKTIWINRYDAAELERNPLDEGWVWASEAAERLGITRPALLKRLRKRGREIRLVRGRAAVRWQDALDTQDYVPPGVIAAARVAAAAGVTRGAVTHWARSNGHPVYHRSGPSGRIAYITRETAEAYMAQRARSRRGGAA